MNTWQTRKLLFLLKKGGSCPARFDYNATLRFATTGKQSTIKLIAQAPLIKQNELTWTWGGTTRTSTAKTTTEFGLQFGHTESR